MGSISSLLRKQVPIQQATTVFIDESQAYVEKSPGDYGYFRFITLWNCYPIIVPLTPLLKDPAASGTFSAVVGSYASVASLVVDPVFPEPYKPAEQTVINELLPGTQPIIDVAEPGDRPYVWSDKPPNDPAARGYTSSAKQHAPQTGKQAVRIDRTKRTIGWKEELETACAELALDPKLFVPMAMAIIFRESGGFGHVRHSSAGAIGLMQVMPNTGRGYGATPEQLEDPGTNMRVGLKVLRDNYAMAGNYCAAHPGTNRLVITAAMYNWGAGNVKSGRHWPTETVRYVRSFVTSVRFFQGV